MATTLDEQLVLNRVKDVFELHESGDLGASDMRRWRTRQGQAGRLIAALLFPLRVSNYELWKVAFGKAFRRLPYEGRVVMERYDLALLDRMSAEEAAWEEAFDFSVEADDVGLDAELAEEWVAFDARDSVDASTELQQMKAEIRELKAEKAALEDPARRWRQYQSGLDKARQKAYRNFSEESIVSNDEPDFL